MRDFGAATARGLWRPLVEFGNASSVSALTTLLAFAEYGTIYDTLCVLAEFTTNGGRIYLTPSHGGTDPCVSGRQFADANAGEEVHVLLNTPNPFTYASVTAQSDNPGVTTASVRWALLGRVR